MDRTPLTDIKWKIYFEDGTTWCDEDGPPESSPMLGVVIVRYWDQKGGIVNTLLGAGWYYWDNGYPMYEDIHGLMTRLMEDDDRSIHGVRQGLWIRTDKYFVITDAATKDSYIPKQSELG